MRPPSLWPLLLLLHLVTAAPPAAAGGDASESCTFPEATGLCDLPSEYMRAAVTLYDVSAEGWTAACAEGSQGCASIDETASSTCRATRPLVPPEAPSWTLGGCGPGAIKILAHVLCAVYATWVYLDTDGLGPAANSAAYAYVDCYLTLTG